MTGSKAIKKASTKPDDESMANEELEKQYWWHQQDQDEQWIEEHGEPDYPYK